MLRLPVKREGPARADTAAAIAAPSAEPDTGRVTDGEPIYRVTQDKAAAETAVMFGARSRLQPPSGADLRLNETFTARVSPGRPAGATVLAQVDISLRAAERAGPGRGAQHLTPAVFCHRGERQPGRDHGAGPAMGGRFREGPASPAHP